MCDPRSTRSADPSWIAYAFNLLLCAAVDFGTPFVVMKKGLQGALQKRFAREEYTKLFGDTVLPNMVQQDSVTSKYLVNELCAGIKQQGLPTYFGTISPNHSLFPGLAQLHRILVETGSDPTALAVLMQRCWHRASGLLLRWIQHGVDHPLGKVRHVWARHEFQTDSGNLSHLNFFVWTSEKHIGNPKASARHSSERECAASKRTVKPLLRE